MGNMAGRGLDNCHSLVFDDGFCDATPSELALDAAASRLRAAASKRGAWLSLSVLRRARRVDDLLDVLVGTPTQEAAHYGRQHLGPSASWDKADRACLLSCQAPREERQGSS